MLLKDFLPCPEVREFVRNYRIVHFTFGKNAIIPAKAYPPKPEFVLHFFLRGNWAIGKSDGKKEYQPPVTFIGQRTFVTQQYTNDDFLNFQIVFQPTALFRLTGIPASELTNQFLDATCIFSSDIRFVYEKLQQAKTYPEMLAAGEEFAKNLIRHAHRDFHRLDAVSQYMMQSGGNFSLDELASQACISTKQFKRKFQERTSINPKTFAKIVRFNKAYNIKNGFPQRDWLQIAIECGYYDYRHLVRDYKEFTGLTPLAFHELEAKSPECVLGLTTEVYRSRTALF